MSIESDLFDTLKALVSDRVFPDIFPQDTQWPAIRYTFVSAVPDSTICGSGDDVRTDFRIQFDGVARTGVGRDALRLAIQTAMLTYPLPNTIDSWDKSYDPDAKAYTVRMDYLLQPSTP